MMKVDKKIFKSFFHDNFFAPMMKNGNFYKISQTSKKIHDEKENTKYF